MKKQARTSKKQIHELQSFAREAVEAAAPAALEMVDNCEDAVNEIAYAAYEAMHDGAQPETADEIEELDRLMEYATETVKREGPAYGIEWEPYQACEFPTVGDPIAKYRGMKYLEFDEPRPTYQRCELDAFLGDPDAYDVDAIEHEATAYDPATGRTVWTVGPEALADIAERHELYLYMAV